MTTQTADTNPTTTVIQCFPTAQGAAEAIKSLRAAGFSTDAIGVLARNVGEAEAVAKATETKPIEDVHRGTVTGRLIGGGGGTLIGLGTAVLPGVGPLIGLTTMVVTGLLGASSLGMAGGFLGALAATGVPQYQAQQFREPFMKGDVLVVVDAGDRAQEAEQILDQGRQSNG
jgi:hypothetical protein